MRRPVTDTDLNQARQLRAAGYGWWRIGKAMKRETSVMRKALKRAGFIPAIHERTSH